MNSKKTTRIHIGNAFIGKKVRVSVEKVLNLLTQAAAGVTGHSDDVFRVYALREKGKLAGIEVRFGGSTSSPLDKGDGGENGCS